MIDALAAVAVVGGALLIALGALGLLRFPDVFTRMHAATKAATVGVIGTTAAAAVEAGAWSGALLLVLVIALLFLSGPQGISLLARAAFHDPETVRAPTTKELDTTLPRLETTAAFQPGGGSKLLVVWLVVVWIALFGTFTPGVAVGAVLVAGVVAVAFRKFAPRWPHLLLHPIAAGRFVVYFTGQVVASTWDVLRMLAWRPADLRPAIVAVPVSVRSRNEVTLLMTSVSFTPGTVALEIHGDDLYVHVLSTKPDDEVIAGVVRMQEFITAAFGGDHRGRHSYHATDDV